MQSGDLNSIAVICLRLRLTAFEVAPKTTLMGLLLMRFLEFLQPDRMVELPEVKFEVLMMLLVLEICEERLC